MPRVVAAGTGPGRNRVDFRHSEERSAQRDECQRLAVQATLSLARAWRPGLDVKRQQVYSASMADPRPSIVMMVSRETKLVSAPFQLCRLGRSRLASFDA